MDRDLQDLLAVWTGGDLEPARCAQLLSRLQNDPALAQALADEVWMLGKLKAVQSAQPRWLRVEDEIGWTPAKRQDRLRDVIAAGPPEMGRRPIVRRRQLRWSWLFEALAASVILLITWQVFGPTRQPVSETAAVPASAPLGRVVAARQMVWPEEAPHWKEGDQVATGRLRFTGGHLTLSFDSGTQVDLEGPVNCDMVSSDRLACHAGKVRVRVPSGMAGFSVETPHAVVVDLGTEFGTTVDPDGKTSVLVFEGQAEVVLLGERREPQCGEVLGSNQSVRIDHVGGRIESIPPDPGNFATRFQPATPDLQLDPAYATTVIASRPWAYWRFEVFDGRSFSNAMPGGTSLRAKGTFSLSGNDANRCLVLPESPEPQWLELDGTMTFDQRDDYAVEVWLMCETPLLATAMSILEAPPTKNRHVLHLEVGALGMRQSVDRGNCRFLHRWPPGPEQGTSLIAPVIRLYQWHHVVGQKRGEQIELYVDGRPMRSHAVKESGYIDAASLVVGRLNAHGGPDPERARRPFVGRIDELALYRHALTPETIADHARRGGASPVP